ncbi:MAG: FkbM family methyltransferase [bacterium]
MDVKHHPVFTRFTPWAGDVEAGFSVNFLGIKTRSTFWSQIPPTTTVEYTRTTYPAFDEEYFEWIDLLESVIHSGGHYTMIELGAGWGRWMAAAFGALRILAPEKPYTFIGVEAEPDHYRYMREHFEDNGIDLTRCQLIEAAVSGQNGAVRFHTGRPDEWYGQSIGGTTLVRSITLRSLLDPLNRVDLIDLDVQGAEYMVLSAAAKEVNEKVNRVHIGTHSPQVEAGLRAGFTRMGWTKRYDFPMRSTVETEYGTISFQDGVQSWINPRFGATSLAC